MDDNRFGRMPDHRVRKGGKVKVFTKQGDGGHCILDLNQSAALANGNPKREAGFAIQRVIRTRQIVRKRLVAQVQEPSQMG
ncbi:hypothetical protein llg_16200 [Luteolibacter sp. LG18]|nr:hypothetical protein llg_16200 [Luteolibacter sp. LG18]